MTPDDYLASLREDGYALSAAARGNLDRPVPSCPEWDVARLVAHVGRTHGWAEGMVRARASEQGSAPKAPDRGQRIDWYEAGLERLIATLTATDPTTSMWTWHPPRQDAGFWYRRMAQETAVHRVDAQQAVGAVKPVGPALAVDGVDEWLEVCVSPEEAASLTGDGEVIHLHRTDGGEGWTITVGPDGFAGARGHHDDPSAVARGSASDLLLLLWRRLGPDDVIVEGDRALLDRFLTAVEL
ncbi:MAG TPA: maleylpyruvate isomerase family mycothiol-dependent enzyme [Actinomycetota bacterium]